MSGVLTRLFPATTMESLTLPVSRSGLLFFPAADIKDVTLTTVQAQTTPSQHRVRQTEGDKQLHTSANPLKLSLESLK